MNNGGFLLNHEHKLIIFRAACARTIKALFATGTGNEAGIITVDIAKTLRFRFTRA
jgi:hypothetical protein